MTAGARYLSSVCGLALATAAGAQPPAPPAGGPPAAAPPGLTAAVVEKAAADVLKDVHNRGAELYNRGDPAAAYRLYEGALMTARPFLAHRPDAQKLIDDGLAEVARLDAPRLQAFHLHQVIEAVRGRLKTTPPPAGKPDDATPKPMPAAPAKPADTTPQVTPAPVKRVDDAASARGPVTGTATGAVTVDGKPAAGVEVLFVTLDRPQPRTFTATADANGVYKFPDPLPAGKYAVTVSPTAATAVPVKYRTADSSGLTVVVSGQANTLDLALVSK